MVVPDPEPLLPVEAFLAQLRKDTESGSVRTLREYLGLFPGADTEIARLYIAQEVTSGGSAEADSGGFEGIAEGPVAFGPFSVIEEIGRGGQAVVYRALDTRLQRRVAVKILRGLGPGSEQALTRFKREAEVAARLEHPGICGVFDAGVIAGTPYISMPYVEGHSLAEILKSARGNDPTEISTFMFSTSEMPEIPREPDSTTSSGPTDRAGVMRIVRLVEEAARALHTAHEAGIIHRDIKPGNLMVTPEGSPVILDFGMARDLDGAMQTITRTGDFFGTPAYMSPEQLTRQNIRVDRRTDVYSLGVTLYECLAGARPFRATTREGLYQAILTKDPQPLRKLNSAVERDLEIAVATALEKDRDRRYQTAHDLAEDLRRVRSLEPIRARPAGPVLRLRRFVQRNPAAAAALSVLFLSLAAGLAVTLLFLNEKADLLEQANTEKRQKEQALGSLQDALDELSSKNKTLEDVLRREAGFRLLEQANRSLGPDPTQALLLGIEAAGRLPPGEADGALVAGLDGLQELQTLQEHAGPVLAARFDPTGRTVATAGEDGTIRIHDTITGDMRGLLIGHTGPVTSIDFSPSGTQLASAGTDATLRVWDVRSGRQLAAFGLRAKALVVRFVEGTPLVAATTSGLVHVWNTETRKKSVERSANSLLGGGTVALSPDGRKFLTGSSISDAIVWSSTTGEKLHHLKGMRGVTEAVFCRDGTRVALRSLVGVASGVRVVDLDATGKIHPVATRGLLEFMALDRDGRSILIGTKVIDLRTQVIDVDSGRVLADVQDLPESVDATAFTLSGDRIALASGNTIQVFDAATGRLGIQLKGHVGPIVDLAFDPGGLRLVSASRDGTARIFSAVRDEEWWSRAARLAGETSFGREIRLAGPADDGLMLGGMDGAQGALLRDLAPLPAAAVVSRDGTRVATLDGMRAPSLWDVSTGRPLPCALVASIRSPAALSGNLARALIVTPAGACSIVETETGRRLATWSEPPSRSATGALLGNGARAVTVRDGNRGRLVDTQTGLPLASWTGSVIIAPGGRRLCTRNGDGPFDLIDAETGGEVASWSPLVGSPHSAAFSRDGTRIIMRAASTLVLRSSEDGGEILSTGDAAFVETWGKGAGLRILIVPRRGPWRVVEGATGKTVLTSRGTVAAWERAWVGGDHFLLLSGEDSGSARLWDLGSGAALDAGGMRRVQILDAAFDARGRTLALACGAAGLRIVSVPALSIRDFGEHTAPVVAVAVSPTGRLVASADRAGGLRITGVSTGRTLHHFELGESAPEALEFSCSASHVIGEFPAGRLDVWPVDPLEEAIRRRPRLLSAAERKEFDLVSDLAPTLQAGGRN